MFRTTKYIKYISYYLQAADKHFTELCYNITEYVYIYIYIYIYIYTKWRKKNRPAIS